MNYDIVAPDGTIVHFAEGTKLQNIEVFAGKGVRQPLHNGVAEGLSREAAENGVTLIEENWQHTKANATVIYKGEERKADVHWFQNQNIGKPVYRDKFIIKEWLD